MRLILLIFCFYCTLSVQGQHRIKLKTGTSLFVEINNLTHDSVAFNFLRQDDVFTLPREKVEYLAAFSLDADLIQANFKLDNPYPIQNFELEDVLYLKTYIKYKNLSYNELNGVVYYRDSMKVKFLTFLDNNYQLLEFRLSEIKEIDYSFSSAEYLNQTRGYDDFIDKITLEEGNTAAIYIYELGYQGIKYSKEPLNKLKSIYTDTGGVKHTHTRGLEFLSYNNIDKIELSNGKVVLIKYYFGKKKLKTRKLRVYPMANISVGTGWSQRLASDVKVYNELYVYGELTGQEQAGDFNSIITWLRINLDVKLTDHFILIPYYSFSSTEKIDFIVENYHSFGYYTKDKIDYQLSFHRLGVNAGFSVKNFTLYAGPQVVYTKSHLNLIGIFQIYGRQHSVTDVYRVRNSRLNEGMEAGISYEIDLGNVKLVPSISYLRFTSDFNEFNKREWDRITFFKEYDFEGNEVKYYPSYNTSDLQSNMEKWEVLSANFAIKFSF